MPVVTARQQLAAGCKRHGAQSTGVLFQPGNTLLALDVVDMYVPTLRAYRHKDTLGVKSNGDAKVYVPLLACRIRNTGVISNC